MSTEAVVLIDLDAIEARANAATKGPWKVKTWRWGRGGGRERDSLMVMTKHGCLFNDWDGMNDQADAEFVAAAREDVDALVAEVRRLRVRLERASS